MAGGGIAAEIDWEENPAGEAAEGRLQAANANERTIKTGNKNLIKNATPPGVFAPAGLKNTTEFVIG